MKNNTALFCNGFYRQQGDWRKINISYNLNYCKEDRQYIAVNLGFKFGFVVKSLKQK